MELKKKSSYSKIVPALMSPILFCWFQSCNVADTKKSTTDTVVVVKPSTDSLISDTVTIDLFTFNHKYNNRNGYNDTGHVELTNFAKASLKSYATLFNNGRDPSGHLYLGYTYPYKFKTAVVSVTIDKEIQYLKSSRDLVGKYAIDTTGSLYLIYEKLDTIVAIQSKLAQRQLPPYSHYTPNYNTSKGFSISHAFDGIGTIQLVVVRNVNDSSW